MIKFDDFINFSLCCIKVAKKIVELSKQNYDCLLVPCRGAFPIVIGAIEAFKNT